MRSRCAFAPDWNRPGRLLGPIALAGAMQANRLFNRLKATRTSPISVAGGSARALVSLSRRPLDR